MGQHDSGGEDCDRDDGLWVCDAELPGQQLSELFGGRILLERGRGVPGTKWNERRIPSVMEFGAIKDRQLSSATLNGMLLVSFRQVENTKVAQL